MSRKLHLIGNAHIDPVWLWQWTEGFHEVKATFRSALDRLNETPDFIFCASSAAFYEWVELNEPAMFAEIQQRVAEGRWELSGGWWIEPDCNLPGGESFARQALLAQTYFQQKFGRRARVGYAPDSFGHNAGLPQLLKKGGMDYYVFMRPGPHEKELPGWLFWWQGQDGSRVLAQRILFSYETWGHDLELQVQRCAAELSGQVDELMCFYGVGDHGGGPTRENIASLQRLQGDPNLPELAFSSPERYFLAVAPHAAGLPVVQGDLQHHASGCYAAHSGIKRWNRQTENQLLAAEKWAAVGQAVAGQAYPLEDLRRAWKDLLFNQFHDILAGSSLEAAYEDARNQVGEAQAIASRALNQAAQALGWQVNVPAEPDSAPLIAFNPHAWSVRARLELEMRHRSDGEERLVDADGRSIPFQWVQSQATTGWCRRICFAADLPPLGYALFRLQPAKDQAAFPPLEASDTRLENDHLRLHIDPRSGAIASLFDHRHGVEVFAAGGGQAQVIEDHSDTWSHNVFRFDQVVGAFRPVSVKLVERGPVKGVIRVVSAYESSTLIQEYSLYRDLDQVDVRVTVDWREHFKLLKLRFPLRLQDSLATAEAPYGIINRPANGDEEPCQGWVDVSGAAVSSGAPYGVSLLNNAKYSYDVQGADLGLTVLRSPVFAHHMPAVPDPDGFYTFQDQGVQTFQYSLLPHTGGWQAAGAARRAAELNQPAWLQAATFHPGRLPMRQGYLAAEPENVLASAFKRAEDGGGWVLRAYETTLQETSARIAVSLLNRVIEARFGPAEIKSFYLPDDPDLPIREVNLLEE